MGEEMNGWLVFEWGQTMRVAITTSPWEDQLMVTLLLPTVSGRDDLFHATLLPADPTITVAHIQKRFDLTLRRAEYLHRAFLQALATFYEDDEAEPVTPTPPTRVIPIKVAP